MPFFARWVHQRQPRYAAGTAATAPTNGLTATPSTTVAAAAVPALRPLRRDSSRTSVRDLLIHCIVRPARLRRNLGRAGAGWFAAPSAGDERGGAGVRAR